MEKLLNTTVYSALWSMARVLLTTGLNFLTTLALAWFLAPADFALIAMTVVFVQLATFLVDSGFSDALIRKTRISDAEQDSVFYLSLLIAAVIYGLIFLAAPLVSDFYSQPILIDIIRIITFSVFFKALVVVPNVLLTRQLSFKKLFWINLPATTFASALCIYLAYHGSGVWALVWQPVAYAVLSAAITLTVVDWRPGLKFSLACIRDLFGFSSYLLINRLLNIPFNNMYLIVLPKVFSPTLVGLYFFAQKIKEVLVDLLVSSVEKVTYSAFAKLQDDEELLHEAYRRLVRTTTFVSFGFLVLCILLAPALYQYALSEDWLPGLLVMQLFCLSALFLPLHSVNLNILKIRKRADLVLGLGIFKKVVSVLVFLWTIQYGVAWVVGGQVVASIVTYVPCAVVAARVTSYSIWQQFADFTPSLLLSLALGGAMALIVDLWTFSTLLAYGLSSLGFIVLYLAVAHYLRLQGLMSIKRFVTKELTA